MSKLKKGLAGPYSLLKPMGDKRGIHAYDKHESLVAWYQFGTDISSSGDLPDLSLNGRALSPSGSDAAQRPNSPTSITSMSGAPVSVFPVGFPTKKTNFTNDLILHPMSLSRTDKSFSFGDGNSDQPFSISAWIQTDAIGANQDIVAKWAYSNPSDGKEYRLSIKNDGIIRFWLADDSTDDEVKADSNRAITSGQWFHIVATYDGRGGAGASLGMKIYINGELDSKDGYKTYGSDANYTAMEQTESGFSLGNIHNEDASRDFNGKYAEVAVWSTELEPGDVKTLYEARYGVSKYTSGIASNPVRVLIREHDQVEGRYPVSTRTSPGSKKPAYKPFNDQDTFVFTSPFATSEIVFNGVPQNGEFIDLTGSNVTDPKYAKKRFVFWESGYASSSFASFKNLKTGGTYPTDKITPILMNTAFRTTTTAQQAALLLMHQINTSSLDIRATYEPEVIEKLENNPEDANVLGSFVRPEPILKVKLKLEYVTSSVNPPTADGINLSARHGSSGRPTNGATSAIGNIVNAYKAPRMVFTGFTINAPSGKQLRYPNLIGASRLRTHGAPAGLDGTASPSTAPDITVRTKDRPGITDANFRVRYNDHHTPFDDSRVPLRISPFFEEGTPETTLPGFSAPLKSKTQIVLNLSSSSAKRSRIFYSSGSADGAVGKFAAGSVFRADNSSNSGSNAGTYHPHIKQVTGSGMAYWSPGNSEWQMIFRKGYPYVPGKTDRAPNTPKNNSGVALKGFDGLHLKPFGSMVDGSLNSPLHITQSCWSPFDWHAVLGIPAKNKRWATLGFALGTSGARPSSTGLPDRGLNQQSGSTSDYFSAYNAHHNLKMARHIDGYHTPVVQWYFPLGDQYNATSSQVYKMSNHISSPFLLEKMHIEIEGVLGTHRSIDHASIPLTKVLFILNQTTNPDDPHLNYELRRHDSLFLTKSQRSNSSISDDGSHMAWANFSTSGSSMLGPRAHGRREIVTWAKIGLIRDDNNIFSENFNFINTETPEDFAAAAEAERMIREDVYEHLLIYSGGDHHHAEDPLKKGVTASFGFNVQPKLGLRNDGVSFMHIKTSSEDDMGVPLIVSNPFGGAALDGVSSGRHLAEGLLTVEDHPSGSFLANAAFGTSSFTPDQFARFGEQRRYWDALKGVTTPGGPFRIKAKKAHYVNTPYLLMPEDNLVIGWQNHTAIGTYSGSQATEENVDYLKNVKITLFGSMVSDNKEMHETLDQVLTTNEIHEAIYGEPVVDQFDVEPLIALSGSTRDALIHGVLRTYNYSNSKASVKMIFNQVPYPWGNILGIRDTNGTIKYFKFKRNEDPVTQGAGSFGDPYTVAIRGNIPNTAAELRDEINAHLASTFEAFLEEPHGHTGVPLIIRQKNGGVAGNTPIYWKTGLGQDLDNAPGARVYFKENKPNGKLTSTFGGGTGEAEPEKQSIRGRIGSIAAGHAGSTGSLTRNVTYTSTALLEDSLVPPIGQMLRLFYAGPGKSQRVDPSSTNISKQSGLNAKVTLRQDVYGPPGAFNVKTPSFVISSNPLSASFKMVASLGLFNNKNLVQAKTLTVASNYLAINGGGIVTEAERLVVDMSMPTSTTPSPSPLYTVFSGTIPYAHGISVLGANASVSATPKMTAVPKLIENPAIKGAISSLVYAAPSPKRTAPFRYKSNGPLGPAVYPSIRMLKYGLSDASPRNPKAYFRRDRYGQFRDLIEQAPETFTRQLIVETQDEPGQEFKKPALVDGWPNNGGPVKSRFFTRAGEEDVDPIVTNCQNLSPFQTSSMPYVDGTNQDRDVVTHPPPDMTDKTSISEAVSVTIDPPE